MKFINKYLAGVNGWCIPTGFLSNCKIGLICQIGKCVPSPGALAKALIVDTAKCMFNSMSLKKISGLILAIKNKPTSPSNVKSFFALTRDFFKCRV